MESKRACSSPLSHKLKEKSRKPPDQQKNWTAGGRNIWWTNRNNSRHNSSWRETAFSSSHVEQRFIEGTISLKLPAFESFFFETLGVIPLDGEERWAAFCEIALSKHQTSFFNLPGFHSTRRKPGKSFSLEIKMYSSLQRTFWLHYFRLRVAGTISPKTWWGVRWRWKGSKLISRSFPQIYAAEMALV